MALVDLRMGPEHTGASKDEILKLLDIEIEKFSRFMDSLDDWRARGALLPQEKAMLKTYLVHKIAGHLDKE